MRLSWARALQQRFMPLRTTECDEADRRPRVPTGDGLTSPLRRNTSAATSWRPHGDTCAMGGESSIGAGFVNASGGPCSQDARAATAGRGTRDLPRASQHEPGRPTPPLDADLDLRPSAGGFSLAASSIPIDFTYSLFSWEWIQLHRREVFIDPKLLHKSSGEDGDMSMVSDAGLLSHPVHAPADHNVRLDHSLSVPATARAAIMDAHLEVATGEDALAPAAPTTAPALPSDTEQTASQDAQVPFTPQSVPLAADMPPLGLAAPIALDQPADMHFGADYAAIDAVTDDQIHVAPLEQRLSAFARLRFRDGSYYMHTYQIILGRNVELAQKDMYRLHKAQKLREAGDDAAAEAVLRGKKRKRRGPARSVVSASGGIVKVPAASLPMEYQNRRQSNASHSLSSSSRPQSGSGREESPEHAPQEVLMQTFDEVPEHLDSFVPEDPNDCPLVPIHPQHVEELAGVRGPKGISREHAKIFYNFDRGGFDLLVLSRNGLFHEGQHVGKDQVVELDHGEKIEIGLVEIKFFLPDVALTEEQRARQESTSRPISFSFENGQGELESEELLEDSASEDQSINPKHVFHVPVGYDSEDEGLVEEEDEEEEDEDDVPSTPELRPKKKNKKQTVKINFKKAAPAPPVKDVKRGHKRKATEPSPPEPPAKKSKSKPKESQKEPPKEKAKASAKEPAKEPLKEKPEANKEPKSSSPVQARKPPPVMEVRQDYDDIEFDGIITAEMVQRHKLSEALIGQPLEKRKGPGRPPKDGVMSKRQRSQLLKLGKEMERAKAAGEDPPQVALAIAKPKAPRPRKDSNPDGEDEDVKESIEKTDGEGGSGDRKQARLNKPARDPSPPMRIEDYTEEQLQRPSANYVVLIHEAISSAESGQMNLQQIYSYIERHYPWYKFKTTTSGWQSSVRHNLGQHEAFMKGDKEGKGYNWKINPAVSIEKERRKRQVSPPPANQAQRPYYPPANGYPAPYGQPGGNYYPGMPPQGHPPNGVPPPPVAQPRLPPSLARSSTAATAPSNSVAPNPSPYASPWAGGRSAGSPPVSGPPSYPPPSSRTPPVTSAPTYGVLYPTPTSQAPGYSASPYAQHGPPPGTSPYANTPARPYTPYATAGAPPMTAQAQTGPSFQAPPQAPNASASHGSQTAHASGRYPAGTNQSLVSQLEAFRDAYLRSMPKSEQAIDAAIQAFIQRDPQVKLGGTEQHLLNAIKDIPTIRALDPSRQAAQSAVEVKVKTETNGDTIPVAPQNPIPDAEQVHSQVASTAAAIAASDAAVEAATSLPAIPPAPPAGSSITGSVPDPVSTQPQAFTPKMTGTAPDPEALSKPTVDPASAPAPILTQASRPSVEPLTPVPGSPALPSGSSSVKKEMLEKTLQDAIAGAKEVEQMKADSSAAEGSS